MGSNAHVSIGTCFRLKKQKQTKNKEKTDDQHKNRMNSLKSGDLHLLNRMQISYDIEEMWFYDM